LPTNFRAFHNEKLECLPRTELLELQERRLRELVHYVYNNSPFYRKALDAAGLKPESVRGISDLQKARIFTTKNDLRNNYPFGLLSVPRDRVVEMHATSGTTGTPTLGLHSSQDLEAWGEISARSLVMSGLEKDDVFQITPSLGMFSGGFGFYHGARRVGCTIVPSGAGFSKRQVEFMIQFGTTMFSAIVSYGFRLAEVASEMGVDPRKNTKVRKGVFGSEIWTREMKKKLSNLWDLDPYDIYGSTELCGPGVGNDCYLHNGLHMWQDHFIVEVVDTKTGEVLEPEEEGELVFTTIAREAMPLIRYRSGDISFMMDQARCDCGRTHQKYSEIKGRTDDMLKISGVNFWPSEVETILLRHGDLGSEYQIRVDRVNSIDSMTVTVEAMDSGLDHEMKELLGKRLETQLKDVLLFTPKVLIVDPNSLPRVEVGKTKRVYDDRAG
jgi:phenylacetate-CoA ligase